MTIQAVTADHHDTPSPLSSFAADLRSWARSQPDESALTVVADGRVELQWTWMELDQWSNRCARALADAGVAPGHRVAHLGRNRAEYVALLYGTSKCRATLVGLNWRLTVGEIAPLLRDCDPTVIAVDDEFRDTAVAAIAAAGIETVVVGADRVREWCGEFSDDAVPGEPEPDDIALIFYTSGTTGIPKGVLLTVGAIAANVERPVPWNMRPGSTVMVCSPVFHTAGTGWIYLPLHCGAHCLLMRDPTPAQILSAIADHRVNQALLVPAVISAIVNDPTIATTDTSSLETLVYGASPISPTLLERTMRAIPCDLVQAYGMTETGGPITYLRPEDHDLEAGTHRLSSAGRPPEGMEIRVVDPLTGDTCPTGERGEVWTRSNQQMIGYLGNPDATADTITEDGWLRTGDAGYLDADGYLFLTDRLSDVIVTGGENVYPVEVENALTAHPAVASAAVIGIPHERWGETVAAVVVLADGHTTTADELIQWCRDRLAHFKAPTSVTISDDLPRNPAGKVLRRVLREPFWADHGRQIG